MESGDVANPFDDAAVASRYEGWYARRGRRAGELETELLEKMLGRFPAAESILEVGCGTGHFTRWFAQKGFDVVGLDVSEAMLREARRLGGPTNYLRADALSLPFADRSYDLTTMITTLEFLADPVRALAEAARVARQGLLLGVLNRWSVLALRYRLSRNPLWRSARFFGPRELATLVRQAAGRRCNAVTWRTTLWPVPGVHHSSLPWGGFIGMAVRLRENHHYDFRSN